MSLIYLVGDGVPADLIPLAGDGSIGTAGQGIPDGYAIFKLVDRYGVAVAGRQVTWLALSGGAIADAARSTDENGIASAQIILPAQPGGPYTFRATVPGFTYYDFEASAEPVSQLAMTSIPAVAERIATSVDARSRSISSAYVCAENRVLHIVTCWK